MGVIKAVFYPSKQRKWGKEVDFGHFYQLIDLNFLTVHKNVDRRDACVVWGAQSHVPVLATLVGHSVVEQCLFILFKVDFLSAI